jgi:hypothetical protein
MERYPGQPGNVISGRRKQDEFQKIGSAHYQHNQSNFKPQIVHGSPAGMKHKVSSGYASIQDAMPTGLKNDSQVKFYRQGNRGMRTDDIHGAQPKTHVKNMIIDPHRFAGGHSGNYKSKN